MSETQKHSIVLSGTIPEDRKPRDLDSGELIGEALQEFATRAQTAPSQNHDQRQGALLSYDAKRRGQYGVVVP